MRLNDGCSHLYNSQKMRLYGGVRFIDRPSPINVRRLDLGALPMIAAFHHNGIRVDVLYLQELEKDFRSRLDSIEFDIHSSLGSSYQDFDGKKYQPLNIGSPDQVARLLFQHLRVQGNDRLQLTPSEKRETTSDDVLEKYRDRHPCVAGILDYRELDKLLGTYVLPLQQYALADPDSRVHTEFSVTTAATGRLASKNPNLQNIPTRSNPRQTHPPCLHRLPRQCPRLLRPLPNRDALGRTPRPGPKDDAGLHR